MPLIADYLDWMAAEHQQTMDVHKTVPFHAASAEFSNVPNYVISSLPF